MTLKIIGSLIIGILCGFYVFPGNNLFVIGLVTDSSLALLLFTVGFDLGRGGNLREKIKDLPKVALAVPFLIAIGSILGTILANIFLDLPVGDAALMGSGFGWYSLSAVIIAQSYDVTLGALSLLTNVAREVLAIILIPIIARKLGPLPAVAPGGATAMDVTLPIISQNTDAQTTLVAIYSGTVLSSIVPFLVPFLIRMLQILG